MSQHPQNVFPHYTPQHPLPAPIQEMPRDETVCQYCGVSYLIHNEIKALEEKLTAAEKELYVLRGAGQREKDLQRQFEQQKDIITLLKAEGAQKDECISGLQELITSTEEKLTVIQEGQNDLARTADKLRKRNELLSDHLNKTSTTLKQHRTDMTSLKEQAKKQKTESVELVNKISSALIQTCSKYAKGRDDLESRVGVLEMENKMLTESSKTLKSEVAQHKAKVESLNSVQSQSEELKNKIAKLESELASFTTHNRQLSMEVQQFQEQLRLKNKEQEDQVTQSKKHHEYLEKSVAQLSQDLQEKIADLAAAQKKLKDMEARFVEQHQKEQDFDSRTAATINESKELKESLTRLRGDLEALKEERELLITSHQNRIEQLRESFKNKMAEAEHWPEKLEQALKKERDKHQAEMTVFSHNVKADFVAELQVEKDKYDKLMEKYQAEHRGKDKEVERRLVEQQHQHDRELTNMRIKLDSESKVLREELGRAKDMEQDLRREVSSLKSIIADLEHRLGLLNEGSVEETQKLKETLHRTRLELDELSSHNEEYEGKLSEAREQILFLEETVRKECEERFELTEKLSDAKKDLMSLRRAAGGYTSSAGSQRSSQYGDAPRKNSSIMSLNSIPSQPTSGRSNITPPSEMPPANNISYRGEAARPTGKIKGDNHTIADHRRRIATMLGKR